MAKQWRHAMGQGFARMGDFVGRSSKQNFWLFAGTLIADYFALAFLDTQVFEQRRIVTYRTRFDMWGEFSSMLFSALFRLSIALPLLAAIARRLHNTNRSTWLLRFWVLSWIVSLLLLQDFHGYWNIAAAVAHGTFSIMLFIFLLEPGTPGPNKFGPADEKLDADVFD